MSLACMPGSLRFRCGFVIRWPVTCTLIIFSVYLNYLKLVVIFELTLFTFAPLRPFIEKKELIDSCLDEATTERTSHENKSTEKFGLFQPNSWSLTCPRFIVGTSCHIQDNLSQTVDRINLSREVLRLSWLWCGKQPARRNFAAYLGWMKAVLSTRLCKLCWQNVYLICNMQVCRISYFLSISVRLL